jgi:hypothetical protein
VYCVVFFAFMKSPTQRTRELNSRRFANFLESKTGRNLEGFSAARIESACSSPTCGDLAQFGLQERG